MKIIVNKKQFIDQILIPVSRIAEEGTVHFTGDSIFSLVNDPAGAIILYSKINTDTGLAEQRVSLNFKDIKKIQRVIECIPLDTFELEVNDNSSIISHKSKEISFKIHLVADNVIKKNAIGLDKINKLTYDSSFDLNYSKINSILKGSALNADTNKVYFFTRENQVFAELTDKATADTDNITLFVSEAYEGKDITTPLPFSLDFLKIVSNISCETIKVKINNTYRIILFECSKDGNIMKYIISAYTK